MKYTITAAIKAESFTTEHGTFDKYMLQLKDESGQQVSCYINQKNSTPAPEPGSELNGSIEPDGRGGNKFKKESSFGGGGRSYGKSPEEQAIIARQNALTNAVNRAIELSRQLHLSDKDEEAKEALKPTNICMAAHHFARFTLGEWDPAVKQDGQEAPKAESAKPKKSFDKMPEEDDHLIHSQDIATGEKFTIDIDDFDKWMEEKEANEQK